MIAKELIQKLTALPPDRLVCVDVTDLGFIDVAEVIDDADSPGALILLDDKGEMTDLVRAINGAASLEGLKLGVHSTDETTKDVNITLNEHETLTLATDDGREYRAAIDDGEIVLRRVDGTRDPITSVESQVYIDTGELPKVGVALVGWDGATVRAERACPASVLVWTQDDRVHAMVEGWDLFNIETGDCEIEKDDDDGTFASDNEAISHVITKAQAGSEPHLRALAIVRRDNPLEWADIAHGCDTETDLHAMLDRHFTIDEAGR